MNVPTVDVTNVNLVSVVLFMIINYGSIGEIIFQDTKGIILILRHISLLKGGTEGEGALKGGWHLRHLVTRGLFVIKCTGWKQLYNLIFTVHEKLQFWDSSWWKIDVSKTDKSRNNIVFRNGKKWYVYFRRGDEMTHPSVFRIHT